MTTISAIVVADSIGPSGTPRLTTLQLRYPRFIHAELMTHRVFSRNARSSRAVPVAKMLEECLKDPVIPRYWGSNQPGMQANTECTSDVALRVDDGDGGFTLISSREDVWLWDRNRAMEAAQAYMNAGYAKQVVNRLLEPFLHIDVLVTGTEWTNFFMLRDSSLAEPHMRDLAIAIGDAMVTSTPRELNPGEWHLPYCDEDTGFSTDAMVSAARCARISYKAYDGSPTDDKSDTALANKLAENGHWSPFEHQATPAKEVIGTVGNFSNWLSHRFLIESRAEPAHMSPEEFREWWLKRRTSPDHPRGMRPWEASIATENT